MPKKIVIRALVGFFSLIPFSIPSSFAQTDLDFGALIQPVQRHSILAHDDYYVWGASMVATDDGIYHLFYSRWPKEKEFKGWIRDAEIAYATATSPTGPFTYQKTVLKGRGRGHWDEESANNPHIKKFGDSYYLYFISHHLRDYGLDERRNLLYGQRIGVAVASSPEGPWQVSDEPLIDYQPGKAAHGYMVNPSVCQRPDGSFLMMFKSRPEGSEKSVEFTSIQCLATSDSPVGPFVIAQKPTLTEATAEDPFIWYQDGSYYAIADDQYGDYLKSGRGLALFRSDDGFQWRPSSHILVSNTRIIWDDGTITQLKYLERPQLWFDKDGNPAVLFCAAQRLKDGTEDEADGLSFNVHIPLKSTE